MTLSLERRRRLVELARERELLVVEDNPYGLLRYEGEPQPPLYQLDGGDYVLYLGTFSKILSPGIRLGWVVRAAAGDGEDRARQAGGRPLHLDPDPVLRPRVLRRGPLARVRRRPGRDLPRPPRRDARGARARTSPRRRRWTAARGRPLRLGDPARLHRHHRPARQGAARERRLRPRRGRLRRRPRRQLDAAQLLRRRPRTRSARASAGSARWSPSRSSSTRRSPASTGLPPTPEPRATSRAGTSCRSAARGRVDEGRGAQGRAARWSARSRCAPAPGSRTRSARSATRSSRIDVGADLVRRLRERAARRRLHRPARPRRRGRHRAGAARDPRHPLHRARASRACVRCMDKVAGQARAARRRDPDAGLGRLQRDRLPRARRRRRARGDRGSGSASRSWSSRPRQGSALGVEFAARRDEVPEALVAAFSYDDRVLLERYVEGRELAVSVLDGEPLPVVEAIPREEDLFNFEARYEIGRTEYVCPAELGRRGDAARPGARAAAPTRRSAAAASRAST